MFVVSGLLVDSLVLRSHHTLFPADFAVFPLAHCPLAEFCFTPKAWALVKSPKGLHHAHVQKAWSFAQCFPDSFDAISGLEVRFLPKQKHHSGSKANSPEQKR